MDAQVGKENGYAQQHEESLNESPRTVLPSPPAQRHGQQGKCHPRERILEHKRGPKDLRRKCGYRKSREQRRGSRRMAADENGDSRSRDGSGQCGQHLTQ